MPLETMKKPNIHNLSMESQKSNRLKRYRQKIRFAAGKIADIIEEPDNPTETDASLYRVQTAIEAVMDIIAMLVKDKGQEVSDDYSNIHILQKDVNFIKKYHRNKQFYGLNVCG